MIGMPGGYLIACQRVWGKLAGEWTRFWNTDFRLQKKNRKTEPCSWANQLTYEAKMFAPKKTIGCLNKTLTSWNSKLCYYCSICFHLKQFSVERTFVYLTNNNSFFLERIIYFPTCGLHTFFELIEKLFSFAIYVSVASVYMDPVLF